VENLIKALKIVWQLQTLQQELKNSKYPSANKFLPATGIIFVSASIPDERRRLTVLSRTLKALGGVKKIKEAFAPAERISHLSLEQRCERAALSTKHGGGFLKFDLAGFETTCRFSHTDNQTLHPYVILEIPRNSFGSSLTGDPMRVELFAAEWGHLCESQEAELAYFSEGFPHEDQRVQSFVDALENDDLQEIVGSNWRTYLSLALAVRWQQQGHPRMSRTELLPSGAYIFSSGRGYNPVLGDANAETFLHADFLRAQIQLHPEIKGHERLLSLINQEVQTLQAIEAQPAEERYYENSHANVAAQDQARRNLFQVRATWACALQSRDLVGVAQVWTGGDPPRTLEFPVVADGGRTWLLPTLLHPFDLNDEAWNDAEAGLKARVRSLLATSRQNLIAGEPPRLLVYFWRGVTPEVREALLAMGADVEVADHLPVFV
jgi:hypothetical protein